MFGKRNKAARKLDQLQVQQIRKLYEEGATQGAIARHFGMSTVQIGRIVRGESWMAGAGQRGLSAAEADGVLQRLLAVQAGVAPVAGEQFLELQKQVDATKVPLSLLDGGDAADETQGAGAKTLIEKAKELGAEGKK